MGTNTEQQSPPFRFYQHYYERVPQWVDFRQIQRGVDVFLAYLPAAGCALFYRSLVGGFSIPKIVEVLVATRYLAPGRTTTTTPNGESDESARSVDRDRERSVARLLDTGGFLACCFAPPPSAKDDAGVPTAASLRPGGRGWEAALRVRVLHAKVRRSLLRQTTNGDGGDGEEPATRWDVDKNGIPINQEDMSATLLAFSVNVLLGIEIASGRPLPENEQRDYLALWRYLGWLLGVDTVEIEDGGRVTRSSNEDERNYLIPIDPCGPRKRNGVDGRDQIGGDSDSERTLDPPDDSIVHSYATLESIILHLLHQEETSRDLVSHLLRLRPFVLFRSEVCRKFLRDPLSNDLMIPTATLNWKGWSWESVRNFVSYVGVEILCVSLFAPPSVLYPFDNDVSVGSTSCN